MSSSTELPTWTWLDYVSAYSLAEDQLTEEPRHRSDIIAAVQAVKPFPASTVSSALSELVRNGMAARPARGWYALSPWLVAEIRRHQEEDLA